ncbi:hypothetical protein M3Y96_00538100 [Aphelenchoides besseyi]|nr:hypothetical protein M3Y96_00538100 [Aphelenchoides besseyi]
MNRRRLMSFGDSSTNNAPSIPKRARPVDVITLDSDSDSEVMFVGSSNGNQLVTTESEIVDGETKSDIQLVFTAPEDSPTRDQWVRVLVLPSRVQLAPRKKEVVTTYLHTTVGSSNYLIVNLAQLNKAKELTGRAQAHAMMKAIYNEAFF